MMEMGRDRISVLVATYNGEKYIRKQLGSIVGQLSEEDELIVSDDGSKDGTKKILEEYRERYSFIKVFNGPGKGYIRNFEFLMKQAKNDIILICDQDDCWTQNKVECIKNQFKNHPKAWVILHDAQYIDGKDKPIYGSMFKERCAKNGFFHNWVKSAYYGCCMAIRKEYMEFIIPFPMRIISYDQWIGLYAELHKKSIIINETLIQRRIHEKNETKRRVFFYRLIFRIVIMIYILMLTFRNMNLTRGNKNEDYSR